MNKWCEKEIQKMIVIISSLNGPKEIFELFDKILTPREINDMARRMTALEMLDEGKSYLDIAMELGMSSNTISRISTKNGFGFRRCSPKVIDDNNIKLPKIEKSKIRYKGAPTYKIKFK
jgi:TrpR-related protein YerC/YecD